MASLEALQKYTAGAAQLGQGRFLAAVPLLERAQPVGRLWTRSRRWGWAHGFRRTNNFRLIRNELLWQRILIDLDIAIPPYSHSVDSNVGEPVQSVVAPLGNALLPGFQAVSLLLKNTSDAVIALDRSAEKGVFAKSSSLPARRPRGGVQRSFTRTGRLFLQTNCSYK
jgi:hypothetical protein